jgi:hypothetical protein
MQKSIYHHTIPLDVIFSLRVGHKLDSLVSHTKDGSHGQIKFFMLK